MNLGDEGFGASKKNSFHADHLSRKYKVDKVSYYL